MDHPEMSEEKVDVFGGGSVRSSVKDVEGSSNGGSAVVIDAKAERALVRKLDLILMPLFVVIFCTNFVDRTAIGNAKIAGLEKDLKMVGNDYNIALTIFYVFYVAFDVPSNLALKQFGSIWLALTIVFFGVVSIGTAFVKSFGGLIATRVMLGICESGTLSSLAYILSRYYRRNELILRIGFFFGVAPSLSGAFGGLLASGLLSASDIGTVTSWRKIFLVEGIITTGFGILCIFIIPADPQKTRLLNESERQLALARIAADNAAASTGKKEKTSLKLVMRAFNFNTILCSLCYLCVNISFQGLALFLPTVVAGLGHFTTVESQLRTVPPYVVGIVWSVTIAYTSYKIKIRWLPALISATVMIAGYAVFVGDLKPHARYGACFLAVSGAGPLGPMFLTWATDNAAPDTVRAVTTGLVPGIGTLGAIIAVWTYLPKDAPNFHNGNSTNLGTGCAVVAMTIIAALYIRWENGKRERGERDYRYDGKSTEEIEQLGHLHPDFRYQI